MLLPALTGLGVRRIVTEKTQATLRGVDTVMLVLLPELGSLVVVVTLEVAVIGLDAAVTVAGTFTTMMMSDSAATARLAAEQVTVPVAPTAGAVQVHPAGGETDSNVVFAGVASVKLRPVAVAGPLLVIASV